MASGPALSPPGLRHEGAESPASATTHILRPIPPSTQPSEGVVVGNPGPLRWMRPMASALAEAGMLRAYVTSVTAGSRLDPVVARAPDKLRAPVERELAVRPRPAGVAEAQIHRTAVASELMRVAIARAAAPKSVIDRVSLLAAERFDRAFSRHLQHGDHAVIGAVANSMRSFRRAKQLGINTVFDYPTAHHRYAERLLREEALRQPAYAGTLQLHDMLARSRARVEEELALADLIIVLGSFQRRTFVESGVDPAKLRQIPLGVELGQFHPSPQAKHDGRFRVLFAGQLTQRKGLSYLVDGFRLADLPDSELTLLGVPVGTGRPWSGESRIRQVGPVRFPELPGVYHDADAFVLPSLIEGFPQTALQAMASGLPVIVSENTFGEDVITDGVDGFVIPIRDADAIAERLRHLHADPELRLRMGQAARTRAEDFSWTRYGERVVAAVRALA